MLSGASNRRLSPRFNLRVPLIFCPTDTNLDRGHLAYSVNLSTRGVYFKTRDTVFVGEPVQVVLQLPAQCGGKLFFRVARHTSPRNAPAIGSWASVWARSSFTAKS
jgi:hypothetical protein